MLTKLIPGYNTATNIASAGAGAVVGGGIASIIGYVKVRKKTKEIGSLQEEIQSLYVRLGNVGEEEQERVIFKVGILKQLAWSDSELHHEEYRFIVDYILQSDNLETDIKLILIENLGVRPPRINKIFEPISKFFTSEQNIFKTDEDKRGFISTLEVLLNVDEQQNKDELAFLNRIKSSVKL